MTVTTEQTDLLELVNNIGILASEIKAGGAADWRLETIVSAVGQLRRELPALVSGVYVSDDKIALDRLMVQGIRNGLGVLEMGIDSLDTWHAVDGGATHQRLFDLVHEMEEAFRQVGVHFTYTPEDQDADVRIVPLLGDCEACYARDVWGIETVGVADSNSDMETVPVTLCPECRAKPPLQCGTDSCTAAAEYRAWDLGASELEGIVFCDKHLTIELSTHYDGLLAYRTPVVVRALGEGSIQG